MSNIAAFAYGFTDKAKDKGDVRFIRITDIDENGKLRQNDKKYLDLNNENEKYVLQKGDILMARTGATYGKTMLFNESEKAVYASFLIKIDLDKNVITPSYYWHFAQSEFYWEQARKLVGGGAQPQFNANVLKSIKILIPPIEEQNRIVAILDKFDALVNDISEGLPAEIKMRRQQYEYYRNKLLTFKEAV
jgi:type I restriction enzyme S subunit